MNSMKMLVLAMVVGFATMGYADNSTVVSGKKVKMDYTLTVNNEEVETSVGKAPLEFIAGDHTVIPGLEKGIEGLKVGEEKVIVVASKDAYGEIDPKALKDFPISSLPKTPEPKVGMVLQAHAPDGQTFPAVIAGIKGDKVTLDFNHPLAGKELTFKVKVLEISDAPLVPAAPAAPAAKK